MSSKTDEITSLVCHEEPNGKIME